MKFELFNPIHDLEMRMGEKAVQAGIGSDHSLTVSQADDIKEAVSKAYLDPLTGFVNRSYFEDLKNEIREKGNDLVGLPVIFIDMNGLKQINDVYGHDGGDKLLKVFANEIAKRLPEGYAFGRLSGDEFLIFANTNNRDEVNQLLANLKYEVNNVKPFADDGNEKIKEMKLSFAFGLAYLEEGEDISITQRKADLLMYKNKFEMKGLPLDEKTVKSLDDMINKRGEFATGVKIGDLPKDEEGKIIRGGAPRPSELR